MRQRWARDCQLKLDRQWARGKSFDTFCPLGPWIDRAGSHSAADTRPAQWERRAGVQYIAYDILGGADRQLLLDAHAAAGTVIMTGTPEGVGFARRPPLFVKAGDVFTVEIGGIGRLESRFVNE